MLGRDYGKQMFWDNVYKEILWLHQILQCNIDVASTGLPSFVTVIHEIHSCVFGAIIEMIWWNYFDACFRLHFCEFYCVLLYILYCFFLSFTYTVYLSVCMSLVYDYVLRCLI